MAPVAFRSGHWTAEAWFRCAQFGLLTDRVAVVAEVRHELAFGDVPDPGRDPVDEESVVRHKDHRPVIRGEHLLECFTRLDIEMVGRLVEDQQVGALDEQARQGEPRSFPAGERGDRTMHFVSPEQESRQVCPGGFFAHRLRANQDRERRSVNGQSLVALSVVADLDVRAEADAAGKRREARRRSVRSSVDLPLPFWPMIATRSPRSTRSSGVLTSTRSPPEPE